MQTFEFEGTPGHVLLQTVCFKDEREKTKVMSQGVFQLVEARDGMNEAG